MRHRAAVTVRRPKVQPSATGPSRSGPRSRPASPPGGCQSHDQHILPVTNAGQAVATAHELQQLGRHRRSSDLSSSRDPTRVALLPRFGSSLAAFSSRPGEDLARGRTIWHTIQLSVDTHGVRHLPIQRAFYGKDRTGRMMSSTPAASSEQSRTWLCNAEGPLSRHCMLHMHVLYCMHNIETSSGAGLLRTNVAFCTQWLKHHYPRL